MGRALLPRTLTATIRRAVRTFPAVLVSGPRQSGKTTLLRSEFGESHRYLSLENPDVRERVRADPRGFLRDYPPPVILDEIQYVPELLSYVKTAIDEDRRPGRWLLTGSQGLAVMRGASQSLAGRIAVTTLMPFSCSEAAGRDDDRVSIDSVLSDLGSGPGRPMPRRRIPLGRWLLRGSYPEPCLNARVDASLWCAGYVQTYLERDVRSLLQVGDLNAFERFLRLCAARTAQILNLSDLARDTGISVPTAKSWLSVLEASHQVHLVPPYFENFGKRVIKAPKLYFLDTAIAAFLLGIGTEEALLRGPYAGPFLETSVMAAWRKVFLHRGEVPSLYYWRSRDGLEIDILIDRNGRLYPMEVKSTATVTPHHAAALRKWSALHRRPVADGILLANLERPEGVDRGVRAVPWDWV